MFSLLGNLCCLCREDRNGLEIASCLSLSDTLPAVLSLGFLSETKLSLEKNEKHFFDQWLRKTQAAVRPIGERTYDEIGEEEEAHILPGSIFETNLDVWRQFWLAVLVQI